MIKNSIKKSYLYTKDANSMATNQEQVAQGGKGGRKTSMEDFRVEVAAFSNILKDLVRFWQSVDNLSTALERAGKGFYLVFTNPNPTPKYDVNGNIIPGGNNLIVFNRKHLKSAKALFAKAIMELKSYFRASKKKTRDPVDPGTFKGVYTPVYASPALQTFFTVGAAGFGALSPIIARLPVGSEEATNAMNELLNRLDIVTANYTAAINNYNLLPSRASDKELLLAEESALEDMMQSEETGVDQQRRVEQQEQRIAQIRSWVDIFRKSKLEYEVMSNHVLARNLEVQGQGRYEEILRSAVVNYLPQVQQGYLLRNTTTMLFYIYAHVNSLQGGNNPVKKNNQMARSDAVMNQAFGGDIAAAHFSRRQDNGKVVKVTMAKAVSSGLIPAALNTYQSISTLYPAANPNVPGSGTFNKKGEDTHFEPANFNTYYFQNIAAANYYSSATLRDEQLQQNLAVISDAGIRQQMLDEHNIVKAVSNEWFQLLEPERKAERELHKKETEAARKASGRGRAVRGGARGRTGR